MKSIKNSMQFHFYENTSKINRRHNYLGSPGLLLKNLKIKIKHVCMKECSLACTVLDTFPLGVVLKESTDNRARIPQGGRFDFEF